jgi:DNA-binding XRE family transcriptional regulator
MISESDWRWIGPWVRSARANRGWTQEQLAERLGVSKANVSHWERNNHQPSVPQFFAIWRLTDHVPPVPGLLFEWPFADVSQERIAALSAAQLLTVQFGLLVALAVAEKLPEA